MVTRVFIHNQHLVGQLVNHEQIRGVGVLLAGLGALSVSEFGGLGTLIRSRRRDRRRYRVRMLLIPASPPPYENHHGNHSTHHDRAPGQSNVASTERRDKQAQRDEQQNHGTKHHRSPSQSGCDEGRSGGLTRHCLARFSYRLRHVRRTRRR
jgi:hypothetical protein